ncbi:hypothetical protein V2A60_006647 [Cordyceps javanica]|nr:Fungal transcriptional regulatory protein [Cordyceps javanica]
MLISSFLEMMHPATDRRFNLVWTYGEFLRSVPQRLGSNTALDVAAQALVASHQNFAMRRPVTADSLARYSDAIKALTESINNPITSHSLETICAVILLTMCQNLSGFGLQHLNSHCQGAVQMLRARPPCNITNEFEMGLHTYLYGPILVQSLFNRTMRLSPSKFEALSTVLVFDKRSPSYSTLALLFQIPSLLQRGRNVSQGLADREAFIIDLSSIYETLRKATSFLYAKYMIVSGTGSKQTGPYGFCLAFSCIFNCMMRAVQPNSNELHLEAENLVKDTFDLVPEAQQNRPLGAAHMMLNLSTAWLCAKDEHERQLLHTLLGEFSWDFRRSAHAMWPVQHLEGLLCDLEFKTDPGVVLAHAG